jgi:hypothetical protein
MPGLMGGVESSIDTNITDMFSHADSIIHDDIYALNKEFYEGYQWVATLDRTTCLACAELDGNIYTQLPEQKDYSSQGDKGAASTIGGNDLIDDNQIQAIKKDSLQEYEKEQESAQKEIEERANKNNNPGITQAKARIEAIDKEIEQLNKSYWKDHAMDEYDFRRKVETLSKEQQSLEIDIKSIQLQKQVDIINNKYHTSVPGNPGKKDLISDKEWKGAAILDPNPEQKKALLSYAHGSNSDIVNRQLGISIAPNTGKGQVKEALIDDYIKQISGLMTPTQDSKIVYAGVPDQLFADIEKSGVLDNKAFRSTSISDSVAASFSGNLFEIEISQGSKQLSMAKNSSHGGEKEVLLAPGKYEFIGAKVMTVTNKGGFTNPMLVYKVRYTSE